MTATRMSRLRPTTRIGLPKCDVGAMKVQEFSDVGVPKPNVKLEIVGQTEIVIVVNDDICGKVLVIHGLVQ